jgi:hypothetical protein
MPLPAPLKKFVESIDVKGVALATVPVIGGVAAAKVGGAVLRKVPVVDDIMAGGELQDAAGEFVGGAVIDAGVCGAHYLVTKKIEDTAKLGGLMLIGTAVGASSDLAAKGIARLVDKAGDLAARAFGGSSSSAGAMSAGEGAKVLPINQRAANQLPAKAPAGLADFPAGLADFPAGLADFPGGGSPLGPLDPYAAAAWGR